MREDVRFLTGLLSPQTPGQLQTTALSTLARSGQPDAADGVLAAWDRLLPEPRQSAIELFLARPDWTKRLLDALARGMIPLADVGLTQRQRLFSSRDENIRRIAEGLLESTVESRAEVLAAHRSALSLVGKRERGEFHYRQNCQVCHEPTEGRPSLGPDLRSVTSRSPSSLLEAILDPALSVDPHYRAYTVLLRNGEVLTGIITSERAATVEIGRADGARREISRDSIENVRPSDVSFMPDGFETKLDAQALADLISFVGQLGR
jgi:putative heme-binding domain-containing protein